MFKKPVDESETQFRPRPSLPASPYTPPCSTPKVPSNNFNQIRICLPEKEQWPSTNSPRFISASASALSLPSGDLSDS